MTNPIDIDALRQLMERLRAYRPPNGWHDSVHHTICAAAADAIEAMATELEALRASRGRMVEALAYYADDEHYDGGDVPCHIYVLDDHGRTARAALQPAEDCGEGSRS